MNDATTTEKPAIPEGYMEDAMGRLVPISLIKPIDLARDSLVREIVATVKTESDRLRELKIGVFDDIEAFADMSSEEYGVKIGGSKGNITLTTYDGKYQVKRAIAESVVFDERIQAAKLLIDEVIRERGKGADPVLMVMLNDAFQVDKEGNIAIGRLLRLKRLKIDEPKWLKAMQAITDSTQATISKAYFRVFERVGNSGEYRAIPLDVAAV